MMTSQVCADGFVCPAGTTSKPYEDHSAFSCPMGNWCASGTQTACLAGTYQPFYGQDAVEDCLTVKAGYYTDSDGSATFIDNECPAGFWCEEGANNPYTNPCPEETFRQGTMAT